MLHLIFICVGLLGIPFPVMFRLLMLPGAMEQNICIFADVFMFTAKLWVYIL